MKLLSYDKSQFLYLLHETKIQQYNVVGYVSQIQYVLYLYAIMHDKHKKLVFFVIISSKQNLSGLTDKIKTAESIATNDLSLSKYKIILVVASTGTPYTSKFDESALHEGIGVRNSEVEMTHTKATDQSHHIFVNPPAAR